jgi:hypothetical protein
LTAFTALAIFKSGNGINGPFMTSKTEKRLNESFTDFPVFLDIFNVPKFD